MYIQRVAKGVRLNVAEATVGRQVRAGLSEAPEIGPNIQMSAARTRPMATPAQDRSASLSVTPKIVKTSMAVAMTSATRADAFPKPRPGRLSPRNVDWAILELVPVEDQRMRRVKPATEAPNS